MVVTARAGVPLGAALVIAAGAPGGLEAQGEPLPAPAGPRATELRIGGDVALGRDLFVGSFLAGVRPRGGPVGAWTRVAFVGISVACPALAPCDSDAWSVAGGLDAALAEWGWGRVALAGGVSVAFWEVDGTRWSPIVALAVETAWEPRVRPFVQMRWERHLFGAGTYLVAAGVSVALVRR